MKNIRASVGINGANHGPDVITVQQLLNGVPPNHGAPAPPLVVDGRCGDKTKKAIQAFQLRHFGWNLADGRVDAAGPTLAKLNELNGVVNESPVCALVSPYPIDARPPGGGRSDIQTAGFTPVSFAETASNMSFAGAISSDDAIMLAALQNSRQTLRLATSALRNLLIGFPGEKAGRKLTPFQQRVLISVTRWLKTDKASDNAARARTIVVVQRTITLFERNMAVRNSSGNNPVMKRVPGGFHAQVYGNPDRGVECGDPFFQVDGPKCRRDVITHEFFHFLGVHHGGSALDGPTVRENIKTPDQALDSADNLAQLVSELMDGRRDLCWWPNV